MLPFYSFLEYYYQGDVLWEASAKIKKLGFVYNWTFSVIIMFPNLKLDGMEKLIFLMIIKWFWYNSISCEFKLVWCECSRCTRSCCLKTSVVRDRNETFAHICSLNLKSWFILNLSFIFLNVSRSWRDLSCCKSFLLLPSRRRHRHPFSLNKYFINSFYVLLSKQ